LSVDFICASKSIFLPLSLWVQPLALAASVTTCLWQVDTTSTLHEMGAFTYAVLAFAVLLEAGATRYKASLRQ
jgi:hypothetical protein